MKYVARKRKQMLRGGELWMMVLAVISSVLSGVADDERENETSIAVFKSHLPFPCPMVVDQFSAFSYFQSDVFLSAMLW